MNKQLQKIRDLLSKAIARAETLADSENEETSEKYSEVLEHLEEVSEAIENAISCLED